MERATPLATARLADLSLDGLEYRPGWDGLTLAALGLGAASAPAVAAYLRRGGNLLEAGDAPVAVGAALAAGPARREQVVVCAEAGRLPAEPPDWLDASLLEAGDVVAGHCLAPIFLRGQIKDHLQQLRLTCLDLCWLAGVDRMCATLPEADFRLRLREAFAALEVAVAQGEIAAYGLSLAEPRLSPALALEVAHDVLGERHHLRALKLPHTATISAPPGLHLVAAGGRNPAATACLLSAADLRL